MELLTKTYCLSHSPALKNCIETIQKIGINKDIEVIVRSIKTKKTLAQLRGLFGVWVVHLSSELAQSQDYVHRMLKAKFLARIYAIDYYDINAKTYQSEIDSWIELLTHYQETKNTEKLAIHAKRISLKWTNLDQMKRYMAAVESHYQDNGNPLPVLDKDRELYQYAKSSNM